MTGATRATSFATARLRRHPLAIRATLRESVTLTYALPPDVLRPLLPPGLELDTMGDSGFAAVALVQTERLRPDGLPPGLGGNFFLAGYRIFTTFRTAEGRVLRGLRILRSDTDRTLMALGGNLLTHYNYHRCRARVTATEQAARFTIDTPDGAGDLDLVVHYDTPELPAGSPFASIREARRFAGPLPFTFDYEAATHAIIAIEGQAYELAASARRRGRRAPRLLRSARVRRVRPATRGRVSCPQRRVPLAARSASCALVRSSASTGRSMRRRVSRWPLLRS